MRGVGDPARGAGDPARCAGDPARCAGDPERDPGDPARGTGDPARGTGDPARGTGDPARGTGDPARGTGDPARGTGDPARGTGARTRDDGDSDREGLWGGWPIWPARTGDAAWHGGDPSRWRPGEPPPGGRPGDPVRTPEAAAAAAVTRATLGCRRAGGVAERAAAGGVVERAEAGGVVERAEAGGVAERAEAGGVVDRGCGDAGDTGRERGRAGDTGRGRFGDGPAAEAVVAARARRVAEGDAGRVAAGEGGRAGTGPLEEEEVGARGRGGPGPPPVVMVRMAWYTLRTASEGAASTAPVPGAGGRGPLAPTSAVDEEEARGGALGLLLKELGCGSINPVALRPWGSSAEAVFCVASSGVLLGCANASPAELRKRNGNLTKQQTPAQHPSTLHPIYREEGQASSRRGGGGSQNSVHQKWPNHRKPGLAGLLHLGARKALRWGSAPAKEGGEGGSTPQHIRPVVTVDASAL